MIWWFYKIDKSSLWSGMNLKFANNEKIHVFSPPPKQIKVYSNCWLMQMRYEFIWLGHIQVLLLLLEYTYIGERRKRVSWIFHQQCSWGSFESATENTKLMSPKQNLIRILRVPFWRHKIHTQILNALWAPMKMHIDLLVKSNKCIYGACNTRALIE